MGHGSLEGGCARSAAGTRTGPGSWRERKGGASVLRTADDARVLLVLVKFAVTLVLMAMCAVGTLVTARFFFGVLWGFVGTVLSMLVAWLTCTSWCRQ